MDVLCELARPPEVVTQQPTEQTHCSYRQQYKYAPLNLQQKEIRLFKITSGASGCTIGQLEYFNHDTAPSYRALSYTWGIDHCSQDIHIEGQSDAIPIRDNLAEFLAIAKRRHLNEYFWIDQICIDQRSVEERNHQVQLMADIFKGASEVVVWLGADISEGEAVRCIKIPEVIAGQQILTFQDMRRHQSNLSQFFQNPYWGRLWIIQELLMAKVLHFYHGDSTLSIAELRTFCKVDPVRVDYAVPSSVSWLAERAGVLSGRDKQSLIPQSAAIENPLVALRMFCGNGCQDHRDRIYGLQGIFAPGQRLEVDYGKSVKEVFLDTAAMLVRHYHNPRHIDDLREVLNDLRAAMGLRIRGWEGVLVDHGYHFFESEVLDYNYAKISVQTELRDKLNSLLYHESEVREGAVGKQSPSAKPRGSGKLAAKLVDDTLRFNDWQHPW